jgi:hypothetical protein
LGQTEDASNFTQTRPSSDQPQIAWIMTEQGNITLTIGGDIHTIGTDHVNYKRITHALGEGEYGDLEGLIDAVSSIEEIGGVTVKDGEVYYQGQPTHDVVSRRIVQFMQEGLPYEPLMRFMDNLMANPSQRSREELYSFLENQGMPITDDGCFVAYKGIDSQWKDCYTHTVDNSIGQVISMPREKVDDDCNRTCSYGYHVGAHEYASNWSQGKVVLVKVNPRDAVSVPIDHDAQKLRVCRYEVVAECQKMLDDSPHFELVVAVGVSDEPHYGVEDDEDWDDYDPYDDRY